MFRKILNLTFGCWLIDYFSTDSSVGCLLIYFLSSVGRLSSIANCSLWLDGRWIVVVWKSFVFVGWSVGRLSSTGSCSVSLVGQKNLVYWKSFVSVGGFSSFESRSFSLLGRKMVVFRKYFDFVGRWIDCWVRIVHFAIPDKISFDFVFQICVMLSSNL